MWVELFSMLVRRVLIIVLGSAAMKAFLGPDVTGYLLGDGVTAQIVAGAGTLGLLLWSFRHRILERLRLKEAISSPPSTSIQTINADVRSKSVTEKLSLAFSDERNRGNITMNVLDWFKKLFSWLKGFAVRVGLDQFIKDNWESALTAVIAEARNHPGVPFHNWKSIVRGTIVRLTGSEIPGNWIDLLISLVFESAKAKKLL